MKPSWKQGSGATGTHAPPPPPPPDYIIMCWGGGAGYGTHVSGQSSLAKVYLDHVSVLHGQSTCSWLRYPCVGVE